MRIYLAGPMRGLPHFNFPAFKRYAARLRDEGHEVFSPAENDIAATGFDFSPQYATGSEEQLARDHGFTIRDALGADMAWLCAKADAIALIPGWQSSTGAAAELATARALGLRIIELEAK